MSEGRNSTPAFVSGPQALLQDARKSGLVAALFAGVISGLSVVSFDISLSALIFSGEELNKRLPMGIGIFLIGSIIVGVIVSLGSSFKAVIAAPQQDSTVITASAA